jgi:AraC-like DNA-binding protein
MSFLAYAPAPPLNRWIECLWHVDLRVPYQRERILPMGVVELIINFGAPFRLYEHDQSRFSTQTQSWLVGLQTTYLLNEPQAETHLIGVRFKPGGTAPFFRFSAETLHNAVVPLDALWGRFADQLRQRLYEAGTPSARFALLERLLLARLDDLPPHNDIMTYAVTQIQRGANSIQDLSDQIGVSHKHLITQFRRQVGITPKALARIYRFQRVLSHIDPLRPVDWSALAHETLYYDQAHFNRDFAAFTGFTPTAYLAQRRASAESAADSAYFVPER